jgi:parvulin-like peptidyl-prolyl isomerase
MAARSGADYASGFFVDRSLVVVETRARSKEMKKLHLTGRGANFMNFSWKHLCARFLQIVGLAVFSPGLLLAVPEPPEIIHPLSHDSSIHVTNGLPFGVALTVNDVRVYESEIEARIARQKDLLQRQYLTNNPKLFQIKLAEVRTGAINEVIDYEVVLAEFERNGGRLDAEELQKHLDEFVQEKVSKDFHGDTNIFLKTLAAEKTTLRELRLQHAREDVVRAFYQQCVNEAIPPTGLQVETYYRAHPGEFTRGKALEVSTIVLAKSPTDSKEILETKRKFAGEIQSRVARCADFAAEARLHSTSGKTNGGYRGWVERNYFRKDLEVAVFALQPTNVTEVVETPDAFFIARVSGRRPAAVTPLSEARETVTHKLFTEAKADRVRKWLDGLRAKSVIHVAPAPSHNTNAISPVQ